MSTLALLKLFLAIAVITLGAYSIYREKDIAIFERKIAKYIKAFFKALAYAIRDKKSPKRKAEVSSYNNDEYKQMLDSLNKASKIDNVLVA